MEGLFIDFKYQKTGENTYEVSFQLNPEHVIFKAHFPGQPILPGITMMRVVRDITASITEKNIQLKAVKNVKFTHVVTPSETTAMIAKISILEDQQNLKVNGTLHHNNAIAAKFDELVYG